MSRAVQYRSDESDESDGQGGYSDNEGIVFAESKKRNVEEKASNGQQSKTRARAAKQDADPQVGVLEGVRLKKRRRTAEVNDLPLHDEEDLALNVEVPVKFKSRIWNEAMVCAPKHDVIILFNYRVILMFLGSRA